MGRPSDYTPEIAAEICQRIAEGDSLRKIAETLGMPGLQTMLDWLRARPDFRDMYARAREDQQDVAADQQVDVAQRAVDGEVDAQAAKVLCDALRWRAMKLAPKKYGERQHIEHSGTVSIADALAKALARPTAPDGDDHG